MNICDYCGEEKEELEKIKRKQKEWIKQRNKLLKREKEVK
jgi:hypothetical protein